MPPTFRQSMVLLSLALAGCSSVRDSMIKMEDSAQRGNATGQVDFYGVKASVFAGEAFKPVMGGELRHRLEKVGPDYFAMTEVYTPSTSAERAKTIAKLGMAMHARQLGYRHLSFEQVALRVLCPSKTVTFDIGNRPITFTRARYSKTPRSGFVSLDKILLQAPPYLGDAPRQEKVDAQLHWGNRCLIINTRDPSDLAPTDYYFSLSTTPPPNFR